MKKGLSFVGSYFCYYIGSFFGYFMNFEYLDFLYEPYKKFMLWSSEIQDWGGCDGPWKDVPQEERDEKEL